MSLRANLLWVALLVVFAGGVFYLRSLAKRVFFEPPSRSDESAKTRLNEAVLQSGSGPKELAVLYFPSLSARMLVAESRPIKWAPAEADRVRQVLLALAEGPSQHLGHPLAAATTVRAVFLTMEGTAYVDLSSDLLSSVYPGIEAESLAVYSIVNSIAANIPSVKRVKILIQGQEVETLEGHADLTEAVAPDPSLVKSGPGT
jgi:spore germination protein GerM